MKNYLFVLSLLLVCFPVSANDDALLDSLRLNLETAEGKTGNALAEAYSDLGDYYMYKQPDSAYYYFQKGIDHLHNHTDFCYSGLLSNMATYYYSIGDIDKALSSYLFALQEAVRLGHDEISTLVSSSLGVIYRRKEMPDSALYYYNRALEFAEHQNDFATIANLYTNIAVLYSATSRLSEAIPYAEKAVGFSLKGNDPVQTVYSYSVYGSLLIKNKEWEKASQILRSGVAESKKMQSSQLVVKCITPLLSVFDCLGQADSVKYYMDIAEKELEIAQLKQIQTEQHALMVKRIFYLVLFLLVLIAAFLVLLYKKKALEKETDLRLARQYIDGLESERKRLAKELHDGVCNDLLGIQYYMQTSDAIGKEVQQKLFPMIEQTRTDVRFISHELMPPAFQYANLNVMLEDYVERLGNVHQLIHFHYFSLPEQANWELVSCQKAYELYRIVQEVLGNSLSHSKATEIEIILSMIAEERKIVLTVSDNAKGASVSLASGNGIGLRTVEDRVKCIDGVYSLTSDAKGTSFIVETGI